MGGLPPNSTNQKIGILILEAAMRVYEIVMIVITVIQLIIEITQFLFLPVMLSYEYYF